MDFASPWTIEPFGNEGSVRATHTSGVQILLSRDGLATVITHPAEISEKDARRLMWEAIEWVEVHG